MDYGIPIYFIETERTRKVPRAGLAAQDDIALGNSRAGLF